MTMDANAPPTSAADDTGHDVIDPNAKASVLTLVRGREQHLARLIDGLNRQSTPPGELVIAFMQPRPMRDLPPTNFPVRIVVVDRTYLPLAEARNAAARAATYRNLIFLDVDCVPSPTLVAAYMDGLEQTGGVLQGEVVYLPELPPEAMVDYEAFNLAGQPHPSRPPIPAAGLVEESDMGMLWGLNFALKRRLFLKVGGLDERFVGYGGEETDFARGLREVGAKLYWCGGARAYHQHHAVMRPPLQHFTDIVRNARLYHEKWGEWCMDYWLGQMHESGFIDWNAKRITVLRQPTRAEIEAARCPNTELFS